MKRSTSSQRFGGAGAIIAILAVILIAGAGVWFFVLRGSSSLPKDLELVSADSAGFVSVRVADIWESEFGKQAREQATKFMKMVAPGGQAPDPMAQLKQLETMVGMSITDVERVTVVLPTVDPQARTPEFYIIVSTKKAIDQQKIAKFLSMKEQTDDGKEYFAGGGGAIYFPEDKIAVVSDSRFMKKFLQEKPKSSGPLESALQKANEDHHIVAGINVPTELKQQAIRELSPNAPPGKFLLPMLELESATIVMDMKKDLELSVTSNFSNDDKAKKAQAAMQEGIDLIKGLAKQNLAELPKAASESIMATLDSLKAKQSGKAVEVSFVAKEPTKLLPSLLLPAVNRMREAAARAETMNDFKQMTIAMHNYAGDYQNKLPATIRDKQTKKPLLSWRVAILPYIEQNHLYRQFKLDEPWDSEHNIKLLPLMPKTYEHPKTKTQKKGMTFYQGFNGPGTPFERQISLTMMTNADGSSNTIMISEAANAVPWTAPQDIPYSTQTNPLTQVGGHFSGGFIVGLGDGSVRFIPKTISETTLRNTITWNDGNVLGSDW